MRQLHWSVGAGTRRPGPSVSSTREMTPDAPRIGLAGPMHTTNLSYPPKGVQVKVTGNPRRVYPTAERFDFVSLEPLLSQDQTSLSLAAVCGGSLTPGKPSAAFGAGADWVC
ncbi:hypothetical protein GCM10009850_109040 [Nonomuraea monospora]|uniref:Uncharacterized protein n=1 Tax=Nonomuraea monospora TaxID=568818 RepID=A0ABP5PZ27_9ACTN